ncbi:hypothetical protein BGZ80_009739 [Entomortierella chlamydospora]|uniref:Uncharacterized protein n=1 Tax=Entomortierella chlamydospora TaxID=101097 RepID=A0A9P6N498_9FUNG|nr:hypothetical protein BGZ79_007617 [Entomortierella chlamydospora]KAG0023336.1 hypothetical protein BGZ80_009739 [Entomortierella chlamydospora]
MTTTTTSNSMNFRTESSGGQTTSAKSFASMIFAATPNTTFSVLAAMCQSEAYNNSSVSAESSSLSDSSACRSYYNCGSLQGNDSALDIHNDFFDCGFGDRGSFAAALDITWSGLLQQRLPQSNEGAVVSDEPEISFREELHYKKRIGGLEHGIKTCVIW